MTIFDFSKLALFLLFWVGFYSHAPTAIAGRPIKKRLLEFRLL